MTITQLEVANLRGYEQATFDFQPGMNLIVGVNGVGKSTVLDALRIQLSKIMPELTASRGPKQGFEVDDIRLRRATLNVRMEFMIGEQSFSFVTAKQRKEYAESVEEENKTVSTPDVNRMSPAIADIFPDAKTNDVQPLALYFSTRRSMMTETKPVATSGQALAFNEALSANRDFNIREIADWILVQKALGEEDDRASARLDAVLLTTKELLPDYGNIYVDRSKGKNTLKIAKGEDLVPVKWLSDGERSLLSLALDLAKRLAFANPGLANPVKEARAIVLIDELDLHLHPRWQRLVVKQLTTTFPNCQFIATTHSPQIIPAVPPKQIQIIKAGQVITPDKSLGMDTNWILKYIMEADDRPDRSQEDITKVESSIREGDFDEARKMIQDSIQQGYDLSEWSIFEARMARIEMFEEE